MKEKKNHLSWFIISGGIQEMVCCLKLPHPGDDLRQDKFGYISASGCGRAIEFFGSQLTVECPILAGHHEFRRKVKEVFQKNLKCVSSHHELRYYVYVLSVMHSVF